MRSGWVKIIGACVLIAGVAGCNRNGSETTSETLPAAEQTAEAPAPAAPQAPAIPPGTELSVNAVSSAMLSRPSDASSALVIRVTGTAASAGWTDAKLLPESDSVEEPGVMTYRLVATSPKAADAATTSPEFDVELRVDAFPAAIKTIRIVSATNEISLPVTQ